MDGPARSMPTAAREGAPPTWWRRVCFACLIAQIGTVSLLWNLIAPLLQLVLGRQRGTRLGRAAIAWIYARLWSSAAALGMMRIDASALDVLRAEPGGLIVAANHPTMLDALVLVARLPRSVCVMKADLMRNVFLGAGARLARYIANDSPRSMIREAVKSLHEGAQLVFFPEGTRTVQAPVNAFRPGITLIARLAHTPVQTVIIETDSPYLAKGWPLLRVPPEPVVMRVRLGVRFAPEADHRQMLARLEAYFGAELS